MINCLWLKGPQKGGNLPSVIAEEELMVVGGLWASQNPCRQPHTGNFRHSPKLCCFPCGKPPWPCKTGASSLLTVSQACEAVLWVPCGEHLLDALQEGTVSHLCLWCHCGHCLCLFGSNHGQSWRQITGIVHEEPLGFLSILMLLFKCGSEPLQRLDYLHCFPVSQGRVRRVPWLLPGGTQALKQPSA